MAETFASWWGILGGGKYLRVAGICELPKCEKWEWGLSFLRANWGRVIMRHLVNQCVEEGIFSR